MALRTMRVWRYIDEIARTGSVRQAAERVNITPSALLRRLQDVEHDLGTAVFERNPTGMRLTAAGELLMAWVRGQSAELARVYAQIGELGGLQRGEVSIACSQACQTFVAQQINAFRARFPQVRFRITVADQETALRALNAFDADLVLMFRDFPTLEVQPLGQVHQPLVAVMAADHPLAAQAQVRLGDCAHHELLLSAHAMGGREMLERLLAAAAGRVLPAIETNSFTILPELLVGTQTIGFHIAIGTIGWRDDARIAIRPILGAEEAGGPIVLGQLRSRTLPIAAAAFADQLKEAMSGLAG